MAKKSTIALAPAYSDGGTLTELLMLEATKSEVVCLDTANLFKITMEGENLKVSNGMVTGGTIEKVHLVNADGEAVYNISGISVNAGVIQAENMVEFATGVVLRTIVGNNRLVGTNDADALTAVASLGNDIVFGRGGDDTLGGGRGKDILIGGGGEDQFEFEVDMGTDKIRDFDANDGDGAQDLIDGTFASATITASTNGKDTIVDFGSGDRFILHGVASSEINANDFTA